MHGVTRALLQDVRLGHDWDDGRAWGHGGTAMSYTDTCRICGLERTEFNDRQNNIHKRMLFRDSRGRPITLKEAAAESCLEDDDDEE